MVTPKIPILFEDSNILVINKPPRLVVDHSDTVKMQTLEDILKEEHGIRIDRGGIVHRLDKDTSGVMVIAKDSDTLHKLQSQFKNREVKKEYIALAHGFLREERLVEGEIMRNPLNREKFMMVENGSLGGKEASTKFVPIELLVMSSEMIEKVFAGFSKIQFRKLKAMNYELFTLLSCHPLTGRTHQIRVHLKYIGNPIVSDEKYGGRKVLRLDLRWCPRQFLHAGKLEFKHPKTGEMVSFEAKLPEDLQNSLGKLV
ncbi:RluA family pseudouridine synthase [Candidatus Daviesbacteria bacterium]|nr:RluA family pseudouridine synthase [Candidatus Daviesbacteria bacterium]